MVQQSGWGETRLSWGSGADQLWGGSRRLKHDGVDVQVIHLSWCSHLSIEHDKR